MLTKLRSAVALAAFALARLSVGVRPGWYVAAARIDELRLQAL